MQARAVFPVWEPRPNLRAKFARTYWAATLGWNELRKMCAQTPRHVIDITQNGLQMVRQRLCRVFREARDFRIPCDTCEFPKRLRFMV